MTVRAIINEASLRVRNSLQGFNSRLSVIPKAWYYAPFISLLQQNTQPFYPRREGISGTENIFQHTIKDLIVLHGFLDDIPRKITIGEISFPPIGFNCPDKSLENMVKNARTEFGLCEIASHARISKLLDVFVLYHDIGKQTNDRRNHEIKGAEIFLGARAFFSRFLSDKEIQTIYLLIKYHGLYGQIDAARRKNGPVPSYDSLLDEMNKSDMLLEEKVFIIKALFLFNIVEGLQSDVFSADFYVSDKFDDILRTYRAVMEKISV